MHPECARTMQATAPASPASSGPPKWVFVLGACALVGGLAFIVAMGKLAQRNKERRQLEAAAAEAQPSGTSREYAAYLWCDKTTPRCDADAQKAIKLYANVQDFEARHGIPCREGKRLCIDPSRPSARAEHGTKVMVSPLEQARDRSTVRIVEGTHAGARGVVDSAFVHDAPPR
ncbi:hypothetical protein [Polyangium spumosum]|uniref:Uncharacterized protein n=1 Tax=Polyangium spumosum TaxID=889282 RepID=A0A6N7Q0F4_9BACT|nr:hypothetical protein [Polyangium spumosum]MRG97828.1 hypothetical protein [Polyangium spumosum]